MTLAMIILIALAIAEVIYGIYIIVKRPDRNRKKARDTPVV